MTPKKTPRCTQHPRYMGARKPKTDCPQCAAYFQSEQRRRAREAKAQAKVELSEDTAKVSGTAQKKVRTTAKPKAKPRAKKPVAKEQPIGKVIRTRRTKSVACIVCGHVDHMPVNTIIETYLCGNCTRHVPSNREMLFAACPYDNTRLRVVQVHEHRWGDIVWFQCDECGRIIEVCDNTAEMRYELMHRPDPADGVTILSVLRDASGDEEWAPKSPAKSKEAKRPRKKAAEE